MARKIVWNKSAIVKLDEIIDYLQENYSNNTVKKFVSKLDEVINKVSKYPEIGRRTKTKKTVRQYRIDKFNRLYYRKYGDKLIIVFIYSDKQDPSRNPYK